MNYLASPPLVVAYALAGTVDIDMTQEPLGTGSDGEPVHLKDVWPTNKEIGDLIATSIGPELFTKSYSDVFKGDSRWSSIASPEGEIYRWEPSTYIKNPPYFDGMTMTPAPVADIKGARVLAVLGDSVTTDHISPAGNISRTSPAAFR